MSDGLSAIFCSACGQPLACAMVEDRLREVCTACGRVHYKNPLPVASSIVVNEAGEVLLVKRRNEPAKGEWCLPVGFAETGETIREAALRELREEAGIEGEVQGLVDVESETNAFYGDMLFVTFAVVKLGGDEVAGDDADEVCYVPLERLPRLAFEAQDKALAVFRSMRRASKDRPSNAP